MDNMNDTDSKNFLQVGRFKMEIVDGKLGLKLRQDFFMFRDGAMIEETEKWILPTNFLKYFKLISKFQFHSSDVIVSSFPRSGSNWVQEIVWNLIHNPNNDNPVANTPIDSRWPSFHGDMLAATTGAPALSPETASVKKFKMLFPGKDVSEGILLHLMALTRPPRLIKAHLPLSFLPSNLLEGGKVIYIAREPTDVIRSLYMYMKLNVLYEYLGKREDFVDYFINDKICFGPYWKHVKLGWNKRSNPNFLFLFYEDLMDDLEREVWKIDAFLGTKRTPQQIHNVVSATESKTIGEKSRSTPPSPADLKFFNFKILAENGGVITEDKMEEFKLQYTSTEEEKLAEWRHKNLSDFEADFRYKPS